MLAWRHGRRDERATKERKDRIIRAYDESKDSKHGDEKRHNGAS